MRRCWFIVAVLAAVLLTVSGCSRAIAGVAQKDPNGPSVAISKDGYGIVVGYADAPVQLEFYTEPQCDHCADLIATHGDDMSRYIDIGQLAITYRPLTFLDEDDDGYSARIANAFFLAADPPTSAQAFQEFVAELYRQQDPRGEGPDDGEIADIARGAGVPSALVERIADGDSGIEITDMDDYNFESLLYSNSDSFGTPTIYDLTNEETVDLSNDSWLDDLIKSA